jgi:hypothetical protein
MDKLGLGIIVMICAVLLGCAQYSQSSTPSQTQPMQQPDRGSGDGGGMH